MIDLNEDLGAGSAALSFWAAVAMVGVAGLLALSKVRFRPRGRGVPQSANRLFKDLGTQAIKDILAPMEGAVVDSERGLVMGRETALQNCIEAYRHSSKRAHWAANELHSTQSDLVEIVKQAEETIKTSRENAEKAKAAARATPLVAEAAVAAIESRLQSSIASILATAKSDAMLGIRRAP